MDPTFSTFQCSWGQSPEFILASRNFLLKECADLGVVFCAVEISPFGKNGNQCKRNGRPKPALIHKRRLHENVHIGYHESLCSQAKSSRTYDLFQKTMSARSKANEEQPDHL